jgi:L-cysteine:1D-myo-inositol 2-amino-2-deoxy-alpha-D-glucopyranoside ligase
MKLYDTLSGKIKKLAPIRKGEVRLYVCGITPYDTTHLGHAFTYITFDTLVKYLKYRGLKVKYTQNITDINDRDEDILKRAKEEHISWSQLADYWTEKYLKDMKDLNWTFPDHLVKASEFVNPMTQMIGKLLQKGLAYKKGGSIYLEVNKFPDYGRLSRLTKKEMLITANSFEEDTENHDKINPLDVTLWRGVSKNQEKHIPIFTSPFGPGRPGWHIECSAMSTATLDDQIDIHGGGKDLIYPHHEAEIIQSEGTTGKSPFAGIWMHTGTVYYQGKKMSKSKGNLVMVADLLKKYPANAIRWLLLSQYWNRDWEFKEIDFQKAAIESDKVLKKIQTTENRPKVKNETEKVFNHFMDNNLNTPEVLERLKYQPDKKVFDILGFKI